MKNSIAHNFTFDVLKLATPSLSFFSVHKCNFELSLTSDPESPAGCSALSTDGRNFHILSCRKIKYLSFLIENREWFLLHKKQWLGALHNMELCTPDYIQLPP